MTPHPYRYPVLLALALVYTAGLVAFSILFLVRGRYPLISGLTIGLLLFQTFRLWSLWDRERRDRRLVQRIRDYAGQNPVD